MIKITTIFLSLHFLASACGGGESENLRSEATAVKEVAKASEQSNQDINSEPLNKQIVVKAKHKGFIFSNTIMGFTPFADQPARVKFQGWLNLSTPMQASSESGLTVGMYPIIN